MKQITFLFLAVFFVLSSGAQPKIKDKKYPSLLWEISGNGLKKSSYLIGTMHVSSKLAFHLPDSFYLAIRNAQVVALETNPETWQDDMSKYDLTGRNEDAISQDYFGSYRSIPDDYLSINTLKFFKYDRKIERALAGSPPAINNLLYRSYGNESSDFEEDTYLDMYIFQCGKKWNKKVTGVENYGESMKLMVEAYKDAQQDKDKKERSYEPSGDYSTDKLQEAYRTGNLDLLDSINRYNSTSAAFDEKFLYRRKEIQAHSIDSIIRSGSALFVGVGAAHLPGDRGVIELLRKKGYRLRPVKMGERDSRDKELLEKIRVPVIFRTETADDGLYSVNIPGKFYKQDPEPRYGGDATFDQRQYADMSNGSYYMVTRIMTNAWMWSHSSEDVARKVDSLLYENVPGKILSKTTITKNGYPGFDITNRTRRGDLQRYQIFVTPFEIIFFKMSGTGEYVKYGEEAKNFFGSIQFKEYKTPADQPAGLKKYSPPFGGFAAELPHDPFTGNDGSWIFDAEDKTSGTMYRIIRTDIHNYHFLEEDTFDLSLMNESFMASEFIDSPFYRRQFNYAGYPALDGKYRDKSGGLFLCRFIIQGPHYYTLLAHGKKEIPAMMNFLNSFEIRPFVYKEARLQKDTSLYFTVTTPVFREDKKISLDMPRYRYGEDKEEGEESETDRLEGGAYRSKTIRCDSTGERIYVSFYRFPGYYYTKDSTESDKDKEPSFFADSTRIFRLKTKTELPDKTKVWETIVTDTGSSRTLWTKTWYKNGIGFSLCTGSDTLTPPGAFVKKFFDSFTPADTLKGVNPFEKKSAIYFADFFSKDSVLHKRAVNYIGNIELDSSDLPQLKKAIARVNWDEKKYLDTKTSLISRVGDIKTNTASDYLKELYEALDDTVQMQYAALESLLRQKTGYSFGVFRNIIVNEPPVLESGAGNNRYSAYTRLRAFRDFSYPDDDGSFLDELSDSLKLTKTILPDLLPLLNLDDYESSIMNLLGEMVDSNLVSPADYEMYFSKFLLEARQELKKQAIAEKRKAIEKAEESREDKKTSSYYSDEEEKDEGNENLSLYAKLLLPFLEIKPAVQPLIDQMLRSGDKRLKYHTMLLLLQHNQPYPDSLPGYFGKLDDYRFELYSDLKRIKKPDRFPAMYNNHLDLGRSSLLQKRSDGKPDSLVYVDRLAATFKHHKGYVYFYKYKEKKDDPFWKLATVGPVPEDPEQFEFDDSTKNWNSRIDFSLFSLMNQHRPDFTDFTETKIEQDEPLVNQLNKVLKKMLYSLRKSAGKFYEDDNERTVFRDYLD